MSRVKTLSEFIIEKQEDFPFATGELTSLLNDIVIASKIVNREVNKAGLADILGATSQENIQGETQQKLDILADNHFISAFKNGGEACGIASEENDDFVAFESQRSKNGKYIVSFDPLASNAEDPNVELLPSFSTPEKNYENILAMDRRATRLSSLSQHIRKLYYSEEEGVIAYESFQNELFYLVN